MTANCLSTFTSLFLLVSLIPVSDDDDGGNNFQTYTKIGR